MSLSDRVAVITGGGTGIGFGIASVLAAKGARLAIAQPNLSIAQQAVDLLRRNALPLRVDIGDRHSIRQMMETAIAEFGRIDILVNNASITGMPAIGSVLEYSPAKVDEIVDVNLKGTFYCSQLAARQMVAQGEGGNIVHIASVGAFAAQEFASLYCATKAAQVSLAQSMALELAPHKIRVNCIAPGDIYTEASAKITDNKGTTGPSGCYTRATPLGRRGSPHDVGHAVAYLVSDEASFVTGATLRVDGGFLAY